MLGAAHSGAPGEVNCTGCHTGTANNGTGTLIFNIGSGSAEYMLGQNYTVTIKLSQAGVNKFGFQVIALKDSNNTFVGSYTLTDTVNTRIIIGSGGKKYLGTTKCGSDSPTSDSIEWSFDWMAPGIDQGTITFYLSSLATDHSHTSAGDETYTGTIQLLPPMTGIAKDMNQIVEIDLYPNPASDFLIIKHNLPENEDLLISIFDFSGKLVTHQLTDFNKQGSNQTFVHLKALNLYPGIHFVQIKTVDGISIHKVLILD